MIPVDTNDIQNEYKILVNELEQYNPELVHKRRILALTKSDMIDDELKAEIILDLPEIEYCFISAVSNVGLEEVKDLIWNAVNQTDVEWNGSNL
jgi:GTP-binding protein